MTLNLRLSDASGVPYYRQVVDQVAAQVRSGALPAGTALPSVRRLAVELKVSVITTRRAYADLEAAGLVVRRQGRGTYVADVGESAGWARGRAREALQAAVAEARSLGLSDEDIAALLKEGLDA